MTDAPPADGLPTDTLPDGTRIGRAALRVADADETAAFYRDVVGLAVLNRDGDEVVLGVDGSAGGEDAGEAGGTTGAEDTGEAGGTTGAED
ncbi:VOC family protein, partial [Halorubrum sp. AD140]|uniref:VOC family protein n=1 Tax=Halorubrum sp. AD140 TaxID=3050073 RepID=UPI002ACCB6AD